MSTGGALGRPRLRLLHTSDVHLGAHDAGDEGRRAELHDSFRRVIDLALRERVDFMVIAGDFIDSAYVRQETLQFAMAEVERFGRPVVVAPGNHDHAGPGSVYDRLDSTALPPNLLLMRSREDEVVALNGLGAEVWGRGHTEQVANFAPFADPPPRGDAPWQLAVGHGHFVPAGRTSGASYQFTEQHLATTRRDYVALGHWEHTTRVPAGPDVVAAYSGAPLGTGTGRALGGRVLVVDLEEDASVRLTAHSLRGSAPIPHERIPLGLYE